METGGCRKKDGEALGDREKHRRDMTRIVGGPGTERESTREMESDNLERKKEREKVQTCRDVLYRLLKTPHLNPPQCSLHSSHLDRKSVV